MSALLNLLYRLPGDMLAELRNAHMYPEGRADYLKLHFEAAEASQTVFIADR
jgi:hypothetical protein